MTVNPRYYADWLAWAKTKALALEGGARIAFISEVWGVFEVTFAALSPVFPITFGNAFSLIRRRFDPLEAARNRMEAVRNTYTP